MLSTPMQSLKPTHHSTLPHPLETSASSTTTPSQKTNYRPCVTFHEPLVTAIYDPMIQAQTKNFAWPKIQMKSMLSSIFHSPVSCFKASQKALNTDRSNVSPAEEIMSDRRDEHTLQYTKTLMTCAKSMDSKLEKVGVRLTALKPLIQAHFNSAQKINNPFLNNNNLEIRKQLHSNPAYNQLPLPQRLAFLDDLNLLSFHYANATNVFGNHIQGVERLILGSKSPDAKIRTLATQSDDYKDALEDALTTHAKVQCDLNKILGLTGITFHKAKLKDLSIELPKAIADTNEKTVHAGQPKFFGAARKIQGIDTTKSNENITDMMGLVKILFKQQEQLIKLTNAH